MSPQLVFFGPKQTVFSSQEEDWGLGSQIDQEIQAGYLPALWQQDDFRAHLWVDALS